MTIRKIKSAAFKLQFTGGGGMRPRLEVKSTSKFPKSMVETFVQGGISCQIFLQVLYQFYRNGDSMFVQLFQMKA